MWTMGCIYRLFRECPDEEKEVAKEVKPFPRIIVATPFAEVAVTIADVVVVVDMGDSVCSHVVDGLIWDVNIESFNFDLLATGWSSRPHSARGVCASWRRACTRRCYA